jgi:hypothetical protein
MFNECYHFEGRSDVRFGMLEKAVQHIGLVIDYLCESTGLLIMGLSTGLLTIVTLP